MERSDECVLVIDYQNGIKEQDKYIASYAVDAGKGIVIVVKKYDENGGKDKKNFIKLIRTEFQFLSFVNIAFVSALKNKNISAIIPEIINAYEPNLLRISTSIMNDIIEEAYNLNLPPSYKGKRLKIYYVAEEDIAPPKFFFYVNSKNLIHFSYYRYLENKIRENIELTGTPIILKFKERIKKYDIYKKKEKDLIKQLINLMKDTKIMR